MASTKQPKKDLTPREFAELVDADSRTVRKFLRAHRGTVGKGKRHVLNGAEIANMKKAFQKWNAS